MSDPIRVLIADDHLVVREGLRQILEIATDIVSVGEARDGVEALELVEELSPDVVLMDLRMPRMDGLEAITRIRKTHPQVATVILTTYEEEDLMVRGLRAGARGYLLKDSDRETLFRSIRAAARGETLLLPDVAARVFAGEQVSISSSTSVSNLLLTERELEVLTLVARGDRNKEIAVHLGITERTVKAHLTSIYNKFGVDSRAAAVAVAMAQGLLGE
ncbi:MAG: response regulator [Anaerolineales bacterium]|nr:response regulator [Anaerolineales bacterium]